MALTRAQLLAGNSSQGIVLGGEVQAVTAGVGIKIDPDGSLSIDATDPAFNDFVKTNNSNAYNGYVWPNAGATGASFLFTNSTNQLSWVSPAASGFLLTNNSSAFNSYVWPTLATPPAANTILRTNGTGQVSWTDNYVATNGPTGSAQLPSGNNAQKGPGPYTAGQIRFNSEEDYLEYYDGGNWIAVVGAGPTPSATVGLGLEIDGTAIKVSISCQFGPPPSGSLPAEAIPGSMYWDDNLGLLFIRYFDGSSSQWVQVIPTGGGGGGGTGTVTSVGIIGTQGIGVVSGSPVTASGNITLAINIATLPPLP